MPKILGASRKQPETELENSVLQLQTKPPGNYRDASHCHKWQVVNPTLAPKGRHCRGSRCRMFPHKPVDVGTVLKLSIYRYRTAWPFRVSSEDMKLNRADFCGKRTCYLRPACLSRSHRTLWDPWHSVVSWAAWSQLFELRIWQDLDRRSPEYTELKRQRAQPLFEAVERAVSGPQRPSDLWSMNNYDPLCTMAWVDSAFCLKVLWFSWKPSLWFINHVGVKQLALQLQPSPRQGVDVALVRFAPNLAAVCVPSFDQCFQLSFWICLEWQFVYTTRCCTKLGSSHQGSQNLQSDQRFLRAPCIPILNQHKHLKHLSVQCFNIKYECIHRKYTKGKYLRYWHILKQCMYIQHEYFKHRYLQCKHQQY